jgi:hypothetical protein
MHDMRRRLSLQYFFPTTDLIRKIIVDVLLSLVVITRCLFIDR